MSPQQEIILKHMREHKWVTSMQAYEKGVTRLSDVIYDLRRKGYDIRNVWQEDYTRYGTKTRYVRYTLMGE